MSIATSWGVDAAEAAEPYPCDQFAPDPAETWFRAVTVRASAPAVYRWLCQMRVAPYSYDIVDNFGRRSPHVLTPGLEKLAVGQRFMRIFELVDFTPDRQVTLRITDRAALAAFGPLTITYAVSARPNRPQPADRQVVCRAARRRAVAPRATATARLGRPGDDAPPADRSA